MSNKGIFTHIYATNQWGVGTESVSGSGSSKDQSRETVKNLPIIFEKYNIKTVLDLSCGDWNWMKLVNLSGVQYLGTDIVDELIANNIKKYKRDNVDFAVMDLIEDPIPQYDLLILRDTLFHFSHEDIHKALRNIKNSGSKYLLTTTYTDSDFSDPQYPIPTNAHIVTGHWMYLNLEMPPFNLPEPIERFFDLKHVKYHSRRSLSLWKISDI